MARHDQQNALGQTPSHVRVCWSEGLKHLLEAGANVNITDDRGRRPVLYASTLLLPESIDALAQISHSLHGGFHWGVESQRVSLLEHIIQNNIWTSYWPLGLAASKEHAEAILDTTIRLVVHRRRTLEALLRIFLDSNPFNNYNCLTRP